VPTLEDAEYPLVPRSELDHRHDTLSKQLSGLEVDVALVVTNPNLYYLAGSIQEGMVALSDKLPGQVYLTRRAFDRARHESTLKDVRQAVAPSRLQDALGIGQVRRLGLELDAVPYAWVDRVRKGLTRTAQTAPELVDVSQAIREVRSVKSAWEVGMVEEAARQSDAAMARVPEVLQEGMTELELSAEVESTMRRLGWEGITRMHRFGSEMFMGGVLSGPSGARTTNFQAVIGGWGLSPAVPHGASRRGIGRGEPVTVDICGSHGGYLTDETRTFVVGHLPDELREAQSAGEELLRRLERDLRPGMRAGEVWDRASAMSVDLGISEGFMGVGEERMTFIGHGVGLELDELPVLAQGMDGTLPEGAIIALEPKLVHPGTGVLGEENTYHMTADGLRLLTKAKRGLVEV